MHIVNHIFSLNNKEVQELRSYYAALISHGKEFLTEYNPELKTAM